MLGSLNAYRQSLISLMDMHLFLYAYMILIFYVLMSLFLHSGFANTSYVRCYIEFE